MDSADMGLSPPHSEILVSYVPAVVANRLAEHPFPIEAPQADTALCACLSLDIAGFTPLAERLAHRGAAGAEQMAEILNGAFGPLVAVCDEYGGEIMEFEGDALLAVWRATTEEGLGEAATTATACGLALQETATERRTRTDVALSMKVVVAAGSLRIFYLGGVDGRRQCLASGPPIAELGELEHGALPDGVLVSARVAALLASGYEGTRDTGGGAATVHSLRSPPRPRPVDRRQVPPRAWPALLEYAPSRLDPELIGSPEAWLAEFRRATSVFVNLIGLEHDEPGELERLDASVRAVQQIVGHYEGSLEKLLEGAKGTVLLIAFGLPPGVHEDDPTRAARAALEIEEALGAHDLRTAIGITTGVVFAGPVGGPSRRDLTIVGDVVNVAARLMQGAEDDILCDRATALSLDGIASEELTPLTVKGKTDPVPVFRVHGEESGVVQERAKRLPMVDRQRERSLLGHALERLDEGVGGVVIVEGEAGIGKSRLLRDVVERAEARGMRVMSGSGDAIESSTPYLAWRPILWDALDLDAAPEGQGARRRHALRWLRAHGLPPDEASLLNNALELRLPESRTISALTPEAQVERTRDLVARVLAAAVGTDPTMIVIEDAHFLDSASWGLLIRVRDELSSALVVLSSRPDSEALAERAEALAGSTHIALDRLGDEDTIELVCSSLGVEELEDDVRDLVLGRAEGHPFFSQELAVSLRDAGAIVGDGGVARMAELSGSAVAVPDTVQGVVASRIDSLEARQQMLLKVASVFGRTFDPEAVRDLLPEETARELVADDLESIEGRGLIEATNADRGSFAFAHSIVRDVSYQSMLHSQRRELHRAAAGWLEARRPERSQTLEPILAHHWLNAAGDGDDAEALSKAELHLTSAGLNALRQGAFVEAESFLSDAHSCHLRLPEDMRDQVREIEILKHLTTASFATHGFGSAEVSGISERTYALAQGRLTGRELFPILWGLWISTYHQHGGTAIELGDRLMEIAEDEGDDELLLQAHHALWTSLLQVPDYARARRHIEAGIARYRPEWHERHCFEYGGHDPGSCAERAAALIGWTTGAADRAVAHGEEAVRLAQDHAYSVANAMSALAFVHRQRRDLDALVSEAKALRERAVEFGLLAWLDWTALLEAWAGGRGGDVAGAIASMEEIAERISLKEPSYVAMLIELYAIAGRTNDGLRMVADAIARVESVGERSYEPELLRLRGVLLAQDEGREDEAERSIRSALSLADQQDALSFALRAATDLARLLSRRGHGDEPAALLRGVRARFTEGFETADLVDADELIAELESNLS